MKVSDHNFHIYENTLSRILAVAWFGFAVFAVREGVLLDSPVHVIFFTLNIPIAVLYAIRTSPKAYPKSYFPHVLALLGTFYVFGFDPTTVDRGWPVLATVLMCSAGLFAIWAAVSLGTSFGLRPVLREVKTDGPYRLVRHPLYCSYVVMDVAEVLGHPTFWNACIAVIGMGLLRWRAVEEERVLLVDAAYRTYRNRARGGFFLQ